MKITLPSGKELDIPVGEKIMSSVDDVQDKKGTSPDRYFSPNTIAKASEVVQSVLPKEEKKTGYDGDGGLAGRLSAVLSSYSDTFSYEGTIKKPLGNLALSTFQFLGGRQKEDDERAASFAETQVKTQEVLGNQIRELERQASTIESLSTKITEIQEKLDTETDVTRANALVVAGNKLVDTYNDIYTDFDLNMGKHTRLLEAYESIEFPTKEFLTKATELRNNPAQLLPFLKGATEIQGAMKLFDTLMRVEAGEETEEDLIVLQKYVNETSQETTFGYKVANTFYSSLPFMMEFLATSGIYSAGSKLTREGMTGLLKKYAGKKGKDFLKKRSGIFTVRALGSLGGAVAMTPFASPTNIAAEAIRGMTPEFQLGMDEENTLSAQITAPGDSFALALTKAFAKSTVENWSERSGAVLSDFVKPAVKEKILRSVFIRTLFNKNTHIPPTALSRFMKEMTNRAGWNGVVGEMFEEQVGGIMHGILEDIGLGDQEFSWPTPEEMLVQLSAFSITGGMFAAPALVAELTGGPNTFTVPDDVRVSLKEALKGGLKKDVLVTMMSESMGIAKEDATAIVENIEYELMREEPDTTLDITGTLATVRARSAERAEIERKVKERESILREQKDVVADIAERLKVDVPVEVVDALYKGDEYFKEELFGGRASGAYVPEYNKIFFSKSAVTDTTGFHETVHFVLHNFDQFKDVLGDITVEELYREANDGKEFSEEDVMDLEEKIAYAAGEYFVSQKAKGKLGTFFEKMKIIMMRLLNALNFDTNKAEDFFRVLAYGRSKSQWGRVAQRKEGAERFEHAEPFKGFSDVTTKVLLRLEGKTIVSKQFIADLTNNPSVRQAEKDMIRDLLKEEGESVNVQEFANKVYAQLLPLTAADTAGTNAKSIAFVEEDMMTRSDLLKWEDVILNYEERGEVADYDEVVYQSPIENSAGNVHFDVETVPNYFAHVRVEDMASAPSEQSFYDIGAGTQQAGTLRRILEIQSDLFQRGRIEGEIEKQESLAQLQHYRNTWYQRIIREEIRRAAQEGKTRLQFPTGETAMKIEGLGQAENVWFYADDVGGTTRGSLNPSSELKVGEAIKQGRFGDDWIITEVLEDGKFKAVSKSFYDEHVESGFEGDRLQKAILRESEQFDISGKVDTSHRVYKFYEKEVGPFVQKKYGANHVTDPQGVEWYEMSVTPRMMTEPVVYFERGELVYEETTRELDKAYSEFKQTLEQNPDYLEGSAITEEELEELRTTIEIMQQTLEDNPVRGLVKYATWTIVDGRPAKAKLPEVSAQGAKKSLWGKRGDSIVTEYGFTDKQEGEDALVEYARARFRIEDTKKEYREILTLFKNAMKQKKQFTKQNDARVRRLIAFVEKIERKTPPPVKKTIKESVMPSKGPFVKKREITLLKDRIHTLKRGYESGRRVTKEETKVVQEQLIQMTGVLAPKDSDKFKRIIKNIQTREQLITMLPEIEERIERLSQNAEKRAKIDRIRTIYKNTIKATKTGKHLPLDYQKILIGIFENYDFQKMSSKTRSKLVGTRKFFEAQDGDVPQSVAKKIQRLEKISVKEMTGEQVTEFHDTIEHIYRLGVVKKRMLRGRDARQKQATLDSVLKTTINPESEQGKSLIRKGAEALGFKHADDILRANMATLESFRVADMIDGYKNYLGGNFKELVEPVRDAVSEAKEHADTLLVEALERIAEYGSQFSEEERARMVYFSALSQNGKKQAEALQKKYPDVDFETPLSEKEQGALDVMRDTFKEIRPEVAATFESIKNIPFPDNQNYFPFKYDAENIFDVQDNPFDFQVTKTKQGFTQTRTPQVNKVLDINIFDVFARAVSEQLYYAKVQIPLDTTREIINTPAYQEKSGVLVNIFWRNFIEDVAKKGNAGGFVDKIRANISSAILGYKLSTILIQPLALVDAMGTMRQEFGTTKALELMPELVKMLFSRNAIEGAKEQSLALRERMGGQVEIREIKELSAGAEFSDKKLTRWYGKFKEYAYTGIQFTDLRTAGAVFSKFRDGYLDQGMSEEDANRRANQMMILTQASSNVADRPHVLNTTTGRTFLTFQTFVTNAFNNVRHDLIVSNIRNKGVVRGGMTAILGLQFILYARILEQMFRDQFFQFMYGADDEDDEDFLGKLWEIFITNIPFFNSFFDYDGKLGGRGGNALSNPITDMIFRGGDAIVGFGKDGVNFDDFEKLSVSVLSLLGVPATSQANQLLRSQFNPLKDAMGFKDYKTDKERKQEKIELNFDEFDFGTDLDTEGVFDFDNFDFGTGDTLDSGSNFENFDFGTGASVEEKKTFSMRDMMHGVLGVQTAHAKTAPMRETDRGYGKTYWIRDNEVNENDLEELRAILFGEISDRSLEKQMLEAQVIVNTVFNRMDEYRAHGQDKSLTEVVQKENQYQAYQDPQYKKYKAGKLDMSNEAVPRRLKAIDTILAQIRNGTLIENTNGAFYYVHNDDGTITYDDERPLFL